MSEKYLNFILIITMKNTTEEISNYFFEKYARNKVSTINKKELSIELLSECG